MPMYLMRFRPWFEPVVGLVFVALWFNAEIGRIHPSGALVLLIAFGVAIAISRVAPLWSLGVIGGVLVLQSLRIAPLPESTTWPVYLAVLIVAFVVGQLPRDRVRWIALACGIPFSVMIAFLMVVPLPGEDVRWTSWVGSPSSGTYIAGAFLTISAMGIGLYIGAWALGLAARLNVMQLQGRFLLQHTARDLAIAETEVLHGRERDWIAREVHDLLAHSLAVVTAQADGARLSPNADSKTKDEALLAISGAARAALIDMQSLVEALREDAPGGPQPTLAALPALLDRLASAGLEVSVQDFGEAKDLTPAKQLAVYRILQESLTNSLRHAGPHVPARVAFDWRGPGLALSVTTTRVARGKDSEWIGGVTSDSSASSGIAGSSVSSKASGSAAPGSAAPGFAAPGSATSGSPRLETAPGHGIRGMKDRARLAGGWLTAGAVDEPDATFIVAAFFPTDETADAAGSSGAAGTSDAAGSSDAAGTSDAAGSSDAAASSDTPDEESAR